MTDNIALFGDILKDLLLENDLSIKVLSEKTGIEQSRIYDFLNKRHIPSLDNAIKIADVFNCPLDYLFGFCANFTPKKYTVNDSVNLRVKAAIDSSRLSRYKLHKLSNISQPQLHHWYQGTVTPSLASLVTLAQHLNCSLDFLAGRN